MRASRLLEHGGVSFEAEKKSPGKFQRIDANHGVLCCYMNVPEETL